jgi:hypothetical protein
VSGWAGRIGADRTRAYALVAAVAALPRIALLLHARGSIWSFAEKSDTFARTFVHSGTFGFIPGVPSAYTQPLYGSFLIPIYWVAGPHWWAVGGAQIVIAVVVAILVYEIALRVVTPPYAIVAALIATLQPYLLWHDVHINREILDQLGGAGLVLLVLLAIERRSPRFAAAAGLVAGVAILGNSRLLALPVLIAAFVLVAVRGRTGAFAAAALLAGAVLAVTPWVVRNKADFGCYAITTDSKALWKANNSQTYGIIASGDWIDAAVTPAGAPPSPADIYDRWLKGGSARKIDECAFEAYWQHQVITFWKRHPDEKAKLSQQAVRLLWDPRGNTFLGNQGAGGALDRIRSDGEGIFMSLVFLLALAGLALVPRRFAALALLFVLYETAAAVVFAGQTRYRVAWDFILAVLAAAAIERIVAARRARRPTLKQPVS